MTKIKASNMITAQYSRRLKDMTYILGSNCVDGVVLVGDRKIVSGDGSSHEYGDKIFMDAPYVVVGSSGTAGLFEKFREKVIEFTLSPSHEHSVVALTYQIEIITRQLNETYRSILDGEGFDVLLGIKGSITPVLRYVYPVGFAEGVREYRVIGHGEPYGSFFLKHWWKPDMTMLEVAELGFFIIKYIQEFKLDDTVGIGESYPQIWLIPKEPITKDTTPEKAETLVPHLLSQDKIHTMEARVKERVAKLKETSWSI